MPSDNDLDDVDFGSAATVAPTLDNIMVGDNRDVGGDDVHLQFDDEEGFGSDAESTIEPMDTPCEFLTGSAGTGKTYTLKQRLLADPMYAMLGATTGIAAINLNATTIHSMLGFFDIGSLRDAYLHGTAQRKLKQIQRDGYKNVVIDEVSMLSNDALDVIYRIFEDVNQKLPRGESPIGLILTGDFAQLPAIPERRGTGKQRVPTPWAFDAKCWPKFESNTTRLTKVWRQADERFLTALNYARRGQGAQAAGILQSSGVQFHNSVDNEFDGTTIVGKNEEVDRNNALALDRVQGRLIGLPTRRWGQERPEWKNIPTPKIVVRENAYVMLLANKYNEFRELEYANGDCGHIKGILPSVDGKTMPSVIVELVRNGREVLVTSIVRNVESKDKPDGMRGEDTIPAKDDNGGFYGKPHYRGDAKKYVSGQIEYFPIRLGYATTCHKAQGLTLDSCQIDFRSWMFRGPAMGYVALSRCRTMEGLRIVGLPQAVADKCNVDPRVVRWL